GRFVRLAKRPESMRWNVLWTNSHRMLVLIQSNFVCGTTRSLTNTKIKPGRAKSCANATSEARTDSVGRGETESQVPCARRMDRRSVSEWPQQFIQPGSKRRARPRF